MNVNNLLIELLTFRKELTKAKHQAVLTADVARLSIGDDDDSTAMCQRWGGDIDFLDFLVTDMVKRLAKKHHSDSEGLRQIWHDRFVNKEGPAPLRAPTRTPYHRKAVGA